MSMSPTKRATASSRRTPDYSRTSTQATAAMPGAVKVPTLVPGKQVLNANEAISIAAEPMTQVRRVRDGACRGCFRQRWSQLWLRCGFVCVVCIAGGSE